MTQSPEGPNGSDETATALDSSPDDHLDSSDLTGPDATPTKGVPQIPKTMPLEWKLAKERMRAKLFGEPGMPTQIGRYRLIRQLGSGAMSHVYLAHDPELDRKVALKLLRLDEDEPLEQAQKRLRREAKTLARVNNPHVVQVYEVGQFEEQVYLTMEHVDGVTLGERVDELKGMGKGWRAILELFFDAADGLASAHAAGLVHRDFKPENVLVGHDSRIRVVDFGLARSAPKPSPDDSQDLPSDEAIAEQLGRVHTSFAQLASLTTTGTTVGTPAYMPPEQMRGIPADARSDQYSFAVTLFEALYGERPIKANNVLQLVRQSANPPPKAPPPGTDVPEALYPVLRKSLSVDPNDRHSTITALVTALEAKVTLEASLSSQPSWMGWGVAAAALLVAFGTVWSFVLKDPCAQAGTGVTELYNDKVKAQINQAFTSTGLQFAEPYAQKVTERLGKYAKKLAKERQAVCLAEQRGDDTQDHLKERSRCLDARESTLAHVVEAFTKTSTTVVNKSLHTIRTLPAISVCGDAVQRANMFTVPEDESLAEVVESIRKDLTHAWSIRSTGNLSASEAMAEALLKRAEKTGYDPLINEVRFEVAQVWLQQRDPQATQKAQTTLKNIVRHAQANRQELLEVDAKLRMAALANRDSTHDIFWDIRWAVQAEEAARRIGDIHRTIRAITLRGWVFMKHSRVDDAESAFNEAFELSKKIEPEPRQMAKIWRGIALTAMDKGKYSVAKPALDKALDLRIQALGTRRHHRVAGIIANRAWLLQRMGRYDEARTAFLEALSLRIELLSEDHVDVAFTHAALVNLELEVGRLEAAERHLQKIRRHATGNAIKSDSLKTYIATLEGWRLFRLQQFDPSQRHFETALRIQERIDQGRDSTSLDYALGKINLAEVLAMRGAHDAALEQLAQARQTYEDQVQEPSLSWFYWYKTYGFALRGKKQRQASIKAFEQALHQGKRIHLPPLDHADILWALAQTLPSIDQASEAKKLYCSHQQETECNEVTSWLRQRNLNPD